MPVWGHIRTEDFLRLLLFFREEFTIVTAEAMIVLYMPEVHNG
jgi:hypothetical protein